MTRPANTEYNPYFSRYVDLVTENEIVPVLEEQVTTLRRVASDVHGEKELYAYAPGKWTLRQVFGHLGDCERVFGYRAFVFSRLDKTALPGFDENAYVDHSRFNEEPLAELVEEFSLVRQANLCVLKALANDRWSASGLANNRSVTVRALAFLMGGHVRHHLNGLRERYGIAIPD